MAEEDQKEDRQGGKGYGQHGACNMAQAAPDPLGFCGKEAEKEGNTRKNVGLSRPAHG
jgi:hypothetical protein